MHVAGFGEGGRGKAMVAAGEGRRGGCSGRGGWQLAMRDAEAFIYGWSWLVEIDLRGDWPAGEIEEGKEAQVGGLAAGSGGDPEVGDERDAGARTAAIRARAGLGRALRAARGGGGRQRHMATR